MRKLEMVLGVSNWDNNHGWNYTNEILETRLVDASEANWEDDSIYAEQWEWLLETYNTATHEFEDGYALSPNEDDKYSITYYKLDENGRRDELVAEYELWMSEVYDFRDKALPSDKPKVWKVYAQCAYDPHPVTDITFKEKEVLDEAMNYQYDKFCEHGGGVLGIYGSDELKQMLEECDAHEWEDDEETNELYEACMDELSAYYSELGVMPCGDWGVIKTEWNEYPNRPNAW